MYVITDLNLGGRQAGFEVIQEWTFMLGINRLTLARKAEPR
jgi:hypothetical protein